MFLLQSPFPFFKCPKLKDEKNFFFLQENKGIGNQLKMIIFKAGYKPNHETVLLTTLLMFRIIFSLTNELAKNVSLMKEEKNSISNPVAMEPSCKARPHFFKQFISLHNLQMHLGNINIGFSSEIKQKFYLILTYSLVAVLKPLRAISFE